jgi:hypothetical protein
MNVVKDDQIWLLATPQRGEEWHAIPNLYYGIEIVSIPADTVLKSLKKYLVSASPPLDAVPIAFNISGTPGNVRGAKLHA